jgi:SET domain-containing protein
VFAKRRIPKDEIIERAPVVTIPEQQWDLIESTTLRDYTFSWGPNDEHAAMALGYISLYNHSYKPNAMYVQSPEEGVIEVVALRDIEDGEEIVVNYNGEPDDREPLWFQAV